MKILPYVSVRFNKAWAKMMRDDKPTFGCGRFENLARVVPGRWGWWISWRSIVVEIGSRNPRDCVGVFLKRNGLWPW